MSGAENTKENCRLILASASPRRHEILLAAGIAHEILPTNADETLPAGITPAAAVEMLSRRKAQAAWTELPHDAVVIAADTVVALAGRILGKPHGAEDARRMLSALSGRDHEVYTGVTVGVFGHAFTAHERTLVRMRTLAPDEIDAYIASGEPLDKAGAYGIQGRGGRFVARIVGDYFNIVGLPLFCVSEILRREFGIC